MRLEDVPFGRRIFELRRRSAVRVKANERLSLWEFDERLQVRRVP
jgi:hypothetical protein